MQFKHRDAVATDLPRIVEIYNLAVATRECSCDLEPTTVEARRESFLKHTPSHRPLWVAEDAEAVEEGVVGYLGFFPFMTHGSLIFCGGKTDCSTRRMYTSGKESSSLRIRSCKRFKAVT